MQCEKLKKTMRQKTLRTALTNSMQTSPAVSPNKVKFTVQCSANKKEKKEKADT